MCSGPCPAGHHCPEGSEFPLPCTSEVEYCPEGSASPLTPSAGHYTVSNDDVVGISFVVAAGKIYNAHAMVGLGADMGKTYPTKGDYAIYLYSDRRVRVYLRNSMKYHAPSNDLYLVNDRFEIKYEDEGVSFYRCRAGTCLQFYTTGVDTTGTGNLLQLPRPIATAAPPSWARLNFLTATCPRRTSSKAAPTSCRTATRTSAYSRRYSKTARSGSCASSRRARTSWSIRPIQESSQTRAQICRSRLSSPPRISCAASTGR